MPIKYSYQRSENGQQWNLVNQNTNGRVGQMIVAPGSGHQMITYDDGSRSIDHQDQGLKRSIQADPNVARAAHRRMEQSRETQPNLFDIDEQIPKDKVSEMYSMKGHQAAMMTMMGAAQFHNVTTSGRGLEPSNDLSAHSSKLVDHAAKKGMLDKEWANPEVTNDVEWTSKEYHDYHPHPELSEREIGQGRRTVRGMIPKRQRKNPEPETLF